jgi:acyl-ACP thioesterase
LDYDAGKIDPDADWQPLCRFQVRNSDQDMQGHVNNTRYAQWVLDAVPPESHRAHVLKDYEVNFLAETRLGDSVQVQAALAEDRSRRFRGVRESDGKVVFLSRLAVV